MPSEISESLSDGPSLILNIFKRTVIMERIYNEYKDGHIDLLDVYYLCIGRLKLSKEDALISTCLTLITVHPSQQMLQKYDQVSDVFYEEPEYVYNLLHSECPYLADKFTKRYGQQTLMHPVIFWSQYYSD